MSVNLVCGLTGTGKTYFIIRMIEIEFKKLPKDFILCANTPINIPDSWGREFRMIHSPKDLLEIERAVVILDDAGIWFGARQWDKLDPRIQDKIINNRKDRLRIWSSTQFFDSIDKYIRANVHQYWEANKIMGSDEFAKKVWGFHSYKRYHPHYADKIRRKAIESRYFFLRKKYIDMYDTYAKVESERKIPTRKDIREDQATKDTHATIEKKRKGRPRKTNKSTL